MARKIIILEDQLPGRGATDPISYRYAFWLDVPAERQIFLANASATSAVKGATSPELSAIQSGAIKEVVGVFTNPPGTNLAQIEAGLVSQYNAAQTSFSSGASNLWDHYSTSWDGTTWTLVVVA